MRDSKGHYDLLVEVREANAAPLKPSACPRGHAMKVGALLDAGDALELDTDFSGCLDVADDLNFGCFGSCRKAGREWDQAEARKVLDFVLSRWQRRVRSHAGFLRSRLTPT